MRSYRLLNLAILLGVCLLPLSAASADEVTDGILRMSPRGAAVGAGDVRTYDEDFHLEGSLTFVRDLCEESWIYSADVTYIVRAIVDGPFRGHYEGWARRESDGFEMKLSIEADFGEPIDPLLGLDGHNAWYTFEGNRKKDNFKLYFDGRALLN